MIEFQSHTLSNGLKILVHPDNSTPLAAINVLYNVGSKDESPNQTGFAHLFEHLMFGGSKNVPSYDEPLQRVGGDNNAFTSNDITNYYLTLPARNIETGFWLESDRMLELDFSQHSLDVQKSVVIEEFKQRYLNQPYGDLPLIYRSLAYQVHPYRWPTIGMTTEHISQASLHDVKDFFFTHYAPNNAVLSVSGNVNPSKVFKLSEKWFGDIPRRNVPVRSLPQEPVQTEYRFKEITQDVPANLIHLAFHMCDRRNPDYHATDLLSDILSNGNSARLYLSLIKKQQLFSEINAYITGDDEAGLFIVTGRILPGVKVDVAVKSVWDELRQMAEKTIDDYELQKVKNKVESNLIFSEINFLNKAMNLAHFELLSSASEINREPDKYQCVTCNDIKRVAASLFTRENCSAVYYNAKSN